MEKLKKEYNEARFGVESSTKEPEKPSYLSRKETLPARETSNKSPQLARINKLKFENKLKLEKNSSHSTAYVKETNRQATATITQPSSSPRLDTAGFEEEIPEHEDNDQVI